MCLVYSIRVFNRTVLIVQFQHQDADSCISLTLKLQEEYSI